MRYHVHRRLHGEIHLLDYHPIRPNAEVVHVFTDAELDQLIRTAVDEAIWNHVHEADQ